MSWTLHSINRYAELVIVLVVHARGRMQNRIGGDQMLSVRPVTFKVATNFIRHLHRHHGVPQGHKFSIAASNDGRIVGVAVVGRPVARKLDDGFVAEVTRLCTDGTFNACSLLYGACARAAKAMGYRKIVTYILDTDGASLRAAGWKDEGSAGGGTWDRADRARCDKHPTSRKRRYGLQLAEPRLDWLLD